MVFSSVLPHLKHRIRIEQDIMVFKISDFLGTEHLKDTSPVSCTNVFGVRMCVSIRMNVLLSAFLNSLFTVPEWNFVKKRKTDKQKTKTFPGSCTNAHISETGMIAVIDRVISTEICGNTKYQEFFPECLLCSLEVFPGCQLVPEAAAFVASEHI